VEATVARYDKPHLRELIRGYGSIEAFAKANGCRRIFEGEVRYFTVHEPSDEEAILTGPFRSSIHLIWVEGQGAVHPDAYALQPGSAQQRGGQEPDWFATLEQAYLVRHDPDLERRVDDELDRVASRGPEGITALIDRLFRNLVGFDSLLNANCDPVDSHVRPSIHPTFGGDEAWNEWLKLRAVVQALARARAQEAGPALLTIAGARCDYAQFYEILQPATAAAIGAIGDERAVNYLQRIASQRDASNQTKAAENGALQDLSAGAPLPVAEMAMPVKRPGLLSRLFKR
jgi:hypothetical protein